MVLTGEESISLLRTWNMVFKMSSSSTETASEGGSPSMKKPASKVSRISRFFEKANEKANDEQEKELVSRNISI